MRRQSRHSWHRTPRHKIKTLQRIAILVRRLKRKGIIVVTTNGAFDILHVGHVRALCEARTQGDILIVGINSDASVSRLKGDTRPIHSVKVRAEMLASLECVDAVFIFHEDSPVEFLKVLRPDVHANDERYGPQCVERSTVERNGGRLHLLTHYEGHSTSETIKRIYAGYEFLALSD